MQWSLAWKLISLGLGTWKAQCVFLLTDEWDYKHWNGHRVKMDGYWLIPMANQKEERVAWLRLNMKKSRKVNGKRKFELSQNENAKWAKKLLKKVLKKKKRNTMHIRPSCLAPTPWDLTNLDAVSVFKTYMRDECNFSAIDYTLWAEEFFVQHKSPSVSMKYPTP